MADLGVWSEDVWRWRWGWRRALFQWEEQLLEKLEVLVNLTDGYGSMIQLVSCRLTRSMLDHFYRCLWSNRVPPKVISFVRKLAQNRIPTLLNLARRGVIQGSQTACRFCKRKDESVYHLFFECDLWAGCFKSKQLSVMIVRHIFYNCYLNGERTVS